MLRNVGAMTFLALCGLLLFFGTLGSPFLYDDTHAIVENQYTQSFAHFKGVLHFSDLFNRNVLLLTFAFNREIGGLDVLGYHLINLMIHICVAVVLYFLIRELVESTGAAALRNTLPLLTATVHLLHPMTVQSVTYLSGRSSILATLFYLLAIYYLVLSVKDRTRRGNKVALYIMMALAFFFLGIGTKEIVATLPIMAGAVLWYLHPRAHPREILPKIALALLPLVLYLGYRVMTLGGLFRLEGAPPVQWLDHVLYFLTQFKVLFTYYLAKLFFPFNLNFEPDLHLVSGIRDPQWMFSFFGLVLLGVGVWYQKSRLLRFGFVWALVTVLPTSSLIPLKQIATEHRTYLPGLGIALVMAVLWAGSWRHRPAPRWLAVVFLILFAVATLHRGLDYRSRIVLWEDTVAKSPNRALAHNNLAAAYLDANRVDDAERELQRTLELSPTLIDAHINRGHVHAAREQWEKAASEFDYALLLGSQKPTAFFNAGLMRLHLQRPEEAAPLLQKAVEKNPQEARHHFNLGNAYRGLRLYDEALRQYRLTVKIQPDHAQAHNNSGVIYWNLTMFDLAEVEFQKAIAGAEDYPEVRRNLAGLYLVQKRYEEAVPHLKRLLAIQPDDAKARELLKIARANLGSKRP